MRARSRRGIGTILATALVAAVAVVGATGTGAAVPSVRGFDGTTIKVGGLANFGSFSDAASGAQGRFKRFNDTNEMKGVKIEFVGYQDDKADPATALTIGRELVQREGVFAVVPDLSIYTPGEYFTQQHVPWFGWGFDPAYCSPSPTTSLYGFGYSGCLVPPDAKAIPGTVALNVYGYISEKLGNKKPTLAVFGGETDVSKRAVGTQASAYKGAGFDVVYAKGVLPPPPIGDVTPYVQDLLTSNNGAAPDAILCQGAVECLTVYTQLRANNYQGQYISGLYSDALIKGMAGSVVTVGYEPFNENTPAQQQMIDDVHAVKAGAALNSGVAASYFAAENFIATLKAVKKQGLPITPENVQKVASKSTYGVKGLFGPTKFPAATYLSTPGCGAAVMSTDGTAWDTIAAYKCTATRFKLDPKIMKGV